jgi:hypothetical protein
VRWWAKRFREPEIVIATGTFLLAVAAAAWIVRPFRVGPVGYDAAASVLYFERISSGRHLEAFIGATPKALLTAVYGIAHEIVPDWRSLSWLAIGAYAAGISGAAVLANRVAGITAAGFVAVGLLGSAQLLRDVDLAYGVSWGLLCWASAGLLVTSARPRYALAGIALAAGGLVRFESLVVVGVATVAIAFGAAVAYLQRGPLDLYRVRLPLLLGLLAIPLQAVHDWLLTGDLFYAERVPIIGSQGVPLIGVPGAIGFIGRHYAPEPLLLVLAAIGLAVLASRRQLDVALALLALGPGIWAFLLFLGLRGIYISDRYIAPADLALTVAAGIGVGSLRIAALPVGNWVRRPRLVSIVAPVLAGSLAALAVIRPLGPLDRTTRNEISKNLAVHRDLDQALGAMEAAVSRYPGARPSFVAGSAFDPSGSRSVLLVPVLTVPQLAVDLRLPLSSISGTVGTSIRTDGTYPRPGQIVFHDIDRDRPPDAFDVFEVDRSVSIGRITVMPLLADTGRRFWLVEIGPSGGGAASGLP